MRHERLATAALLLLAAGLAGCASLAYTPVPVDSAAPADSGVPCAAGLQPGQRCTALVRAAQWQTPTGLQVGLGESEAEAYCVQVPPGQVWFDQDRRNTPPHGEQGSWLMQLGSGLKRHHGIAWFSLVAAVQPAGAAKKPDHQDISRDPVVRPRQAGALVLYPNDAVGQPDDPTWFYRNNRGQIWVTLQRCDSACDCPPAQPD